VKPLGTRWAVVGAACLAAACADVWGFRDLTGTDGGVNPEGGSGSGSGGASGSSSGSDSDSSSGSGSSSDASADNAASQDGPDDTFTADASDAHEDAGVPLCCTIVDPGTVCTSGEVFPCTSSAVSCPSATSSCIFTDPGNGTCDGVVGPCE
jgi:hypothetical protein